MPDNKAEQPQSSDFLFSFRTAATSIALAAVILVSGVVLATYIQQKEPDAPVAIATLPKEVANEAISQVTQQVTQEVVEEAPEAVLSIPEEQQVMRAPKIVLAEPILADTEQPTAMIQPEPEPKI